MTQILVKQHYTCLERTLQLNERLQLVAQKMLVYKHVKGFTWYFFLGVGCNGAFIKPPNTTPCLSLATWIRTMWVKSLD